MSLKEEVSLQTQEIKQKQVPLGGIMFAVQLKVWQTIKIYKHNKKCLNKVDLLSVHSTLTALADTY